jgi:molybdenum-dependent DNA-binding transcriptional regulator ModE
MSLTDASLTGLRVFRAVAEHGTLSAAAAALGYTQSAVSRQVAALERAAGTVLLERHHNGVRLTPAGQVVLRSAAAVVDRIDATSRELNGVREERVVVRLGWFASAGAVLIPRAVAMLSRSRPGITVLSREGGTSALVYHRAIARSAAQTAVAPHSAMASSKSVLRSGLRWDRPGAKSLSANSSATMRIPRTSMSAARASLCAATPGVVPAMALTNTMPSTRERSMSAASNASMPPRE